MSASSSSSNPEHAANRLSELLAAGDGGYSWDDVARFAESLANGLRIRSGPVDIHTALGKSPLPHTLSSLLKLSLEGLRIPHEERTAAVYELLRVGANLCMDHNENRAALLDVGYPQTVVSLVEGYTESLPASPLVEPLPLSIPHLKIIKTAIGVVLNLSLGYEPVQTRLMSLEIPSTLLRLLTAIYPAGSWQLGSSSSSDISEEWNLRSTISEWSWRAISGLKDNKAKQFLFDPDSLPQLVAPLRAFVPPFPPYEPRSPLFSNATLRRSLFISDVDALEEVAELLESLTEDVEDVRLSLARGMTFPEEHGGQPCLTRMLDFVELAEYPPNWTVEPNPVTPQELGRWRNAIDTCKTAVIKAIVETTGEERNLEVLWDIAEAEEGEGFVARMVKWLRDSAGAPSGQARDDLVICASLSLGNLVRREHHSITLVKPPIDIVPLLVAQLLPTTDIKVKHGIVGLLKHLSQAQPNRPLIGEARALEKLRTSEIFSGRADIAEIVQMSGIGLSKHLCTGNVNNAITLVLDATDNDASTTLLAQILRLVRRSDSVAVKSEGTRVLVNAIKSLCATSGDVHDARRQQAIGALIQRDNADALAQLLGRSKKHTVLLNEAIMAMYLLALQPKGAPLVLDAVVVHLPAEPRPHRTLSSAINDSNAASPVVAPAAALDMLVTILQNAEGKYPAELRMNLCGLLSELSRYELKSDSVGRIREVDRVRVSVRGPLEKTTASENLALAVAAKRVFQGWSS